MEPTPYATSRERLDDALERVRLLLTRHIVRTWYRLTDQLGELRDTVISMEEVRLSLEGLGTLHPPHERRGLPSLEALEEALEAHQLHVARRLARSAAGPPLSVEGLQELLALDPLELDVIMVVGAPQLDVGVARLARLAWADAAVRHPTVGFVCEVLADRREDLDAVRRCLMPGHRLRVLRVLEAVKPVLHQSHLPDLGEAVCLPGRVLAFLLDAATLVADEPRRDCGHDDLDINCEVLHAPRGLDALGQTEEVSRRFQTARQYARQLALQRREGPREGWLSERVPLVVVVGADDGDHAAVVHSCLPSPQPLVDIQLWRVVTRLAGHPISRLHHALEETLAVGLREAMLLRGTAMVSLREMLTDSRVEAATLDAMRRVLSRSHGLIVLSVARMVAPLRELLGPSAELEIRPPEAEPRLTLWARELSRVGAEAPPEVALRELAYRYAATARTIRLAAHRAAFHARVDTSRDGPTVHIQDLDLAVRHQMQHKLDILARPFTTSMTWDDMVLPQELLQRLQEMVNYSKNKRLVHEQWGFARLNTYGHGLTALFSGPPGTGKTASAAIIARELGSELYMIDLSRVVDKYIGETEKNLGRIFDEAERSNVVLLFDEADSLFAKRTEVKSSNDRYANLEVNYLLQRMEHFPGTSILTTNLDSEMDDALQRRIGFRVAFKLPDERDRELLWQKLLPEEAPTDDDIDFARLAAEFELAPAFIKNAISRAAFAAANDGGTIDYDKLYDAASAEIRELGHLVQHRGPY